MPTPDFFSVRLHAFLELASALKQVVVQRDDDQWRRLIAGLDVSTWDRNLHAVQRLLPPSVENLLDREPELDPTEIPGWDDLGLRVALRRLAELAADYRVTLTTTDFTWRLRDILQYGNFDQNDPGAREVRILLHFLSSRSPVPEPLEYFKDPDAHHGLLTFLA